MKFTFTGEEFAGTKTTVEFHADRLDDVLDNFKQFLQGSGFVLGMNENVEVVDRTWEFNSSFQYEPPEYYDDSFLNSGTADINLDLDDIQITIPEEEPKAKKGKK